MSPRKKATPTPLGNHIIRRRKAKGWTTADLAGKSGLSYSTVRNVEKGNSVKPSEAVLRAIIAALECDEGVIFAYAGYNIPKRSQEERDAMFDDLGERAPAWRAAIEGVKRDMTPDQQDQALEVLLAQLASARRLLGRP